MGFCIKKLGVPARRLVQQEQPAFSLSKNLCDNLRHLRHLKKIISDIYLLHPSLQCHIIMKLSRAFLTQNCLGLGRYLVIDGEGISALTRLYNEGASTHLMEGQMRQVEGGAKVNSAGQIY